MTPIGFDPDAGVLVIADNNVFPAGSLRAAVHPTWMDRIQIDSIAGRGEQTIPWWQIRRLDPSDPWVPSGMDDALAYLRAEFAKRPSSAEFTQASAALSWTIPHHLGFRPNVSVIDSAGDLCLADVTWPDPATVIVRFGAPTAGTAYLS